MNECAIKHFATKSEKKCLEYHFHLNYEILYIKKGNIVMHTAGSRINLSQGMLCVIPAFAPHKSIYKDAEVIHILFERSYMESYIVPEAVSNASKSVNTYVSVSKKNNMGEVIDALVEEIDVYGGESAYIYLLKILMSCNDFTHNMSDEGNIVLTAIKYIGDNSKSKLSLDEIAKNCNVTKYHICRLFKKELGITPVEYITFAKIRRAVTKLNTTNYTIAKISSGLSFYSPKYFTKIFKSYFGISPSSFRKNKGFEIKDRYYLSVSKNH